MPTLREMSKGTWNGNPTVEEINAGSLQRIADATEVMAKNYIQLQRDVDYYKGRTSDETRRVKQRDRTISNLRGQITKLKKKLAIASQFEQVG